MGLISRVSSRTYRKCDRMSKKNHINPATPSSSSFSFESRFQKLANSKSPKNTKSTFSPKPENFNTTHDYIDALIKHSERSLELCLNSTRLNSLTVQNPIHKKLSTTLQIVDLSKNSIQEVPCLIRDCISLNRLYLNFNRIKFTPQNH